jgi:hypothetical protein
MKGLFIDRHGASPAGFLRLAPERYPDPCKVGEIRLAS